MLYFPVQYFGHMWPCNNTAQSCFNQGQLSNWSYSNASVYRKLISKGMGLHRWATIPPFSCSRRKLMRKLVK